MAKSRIFRAFLRRLVFAIGCESGATAIEFAFVAPIFLAILLAIVQVSVVYVAQSYLEAVTEDAMRVVLTNQSYNMQKTDFANKICTYVTGLFDCTKLIVSLQPVTASTASQVAAALPTFDSTGALVATPPYNPGTTGDKMLLVVMYHWPVIGGPFGLTLSNLGDGTRLLIATEVFYKEPCLDPAGCKFTSSG